MDWKKNAKIDILNYFFKDKAIKSNIFWNYSLKITFPITTVDFMTENLANYSKIILHYFKKFYLLKIIKERNLQ